MKDEINIKRIIVAVIISLVFSYFLGIYVNPYKYVNINKFKQTFDKIHQSQCIAPSRLYINAWRNAQINYIDSTMNNQNWIRWRNRYNGKIKTMDDAYVAINTMLASLNDSYTTFLQSQQFENQQLIANSKVKGVGIVFEKSKDGLVVNTVLEKSPAAEKNIVSGDKIKEINGIKVDNISVEDIKQIINNEKDEVVIEIQRGDKIIKNELKKTEIPIDTMEYTITKDNIGIIFLPTIMGEKAIEDFENILKDTNNTKGLIIDLRNNRGGILANAIQMADLMMSDKNIINIESKENIKFEFFANENSVFKIKPLVILINNKTASASEILAGTLQCNLDAILIGEKSYGKNSIQYVVPMSNGAGMVITSEKYIFSNGNDIFHKGLTPDIDTTKKHNSNEDVDLIEAQKLINEIVEIQK